MFAVLSFSLVKHDFKHTVTHSIGTDDLYPFTLCSIKYDTLY